MRARTLGELRVPAVGLGVMGIPAIHAVEDFAAHELSQPEGGSGARFFDHVAYGLLRSEWAGLPRDRAVIPGPAAGGCGGRASR